MGRKEGEERRGKGTLEWKEGGEECRFMHLYFRKMILELAE